MKEEASLEAFESTLNLAFKQMLELEGRLAAGEAVEEEEIGAVAKDAANQLEDALDVLEGVICEFDLPPLKEPQPVRIGEASAL